MGNNGRTLTPALMLCLTAYRELCFELARPPRCAELAERLGGIRPQSVYASLERLATRADYDLPLSRAAGRGDVHRPQSPELPSAEAERQELVSLMRLADRLVSRYGDPDDAEWSEFRQRGARYLESPFARAHKAAK
jgi:hypothetical protein